MVTRPQLRVVKDDGMESVSEFVNNDEGRENESTEWDRRNKHTIENQPIDQWDVMTPTMWCRSFCNNTYMMVKNNLKRWQLYTFFSSQRSALMVELVYSWKQNYLHSKGLDPMVKTKTMSFSPLKTKLFALKGVGSNSEN